MGHVYYTEPARMTQYRIEIADRPFRKKRRRIKRIGFTKIDLDSRADSDLKSNKGIRITNEVDYDEKKKTRTDNGLYSPRFGADSFLSRSSDDMCHCECGAISGGIHEGEICPSCGSRVKFIDADLSIKGYIPLGNFYVISPAVYLDLEKLIGGKELLNILKYNERYDVKGKHVRTATKSSPFNGMGMINFKEHFDEIIDFYLKKRKDKKDSYDNIQIYKKAVFTRYVSVYSSLLRPYVKDESRMSVFDSNKKYSVILANANIIRQDRPVGVDDKLIIEKSLFEIQTQWNELLHSIIDDYLSGKRGIFRAQMTAARISYSGRGIVVPAVFHRCNEVSIPYVMGCELLRPLLINAIRTMDGKNSREANTIIDNGIREFDEKLWLLMNHILQKSKNPPMLMIQRSPSLLQESMRLMNIKTVKYDYTDLTIDVPVAILSGMNADFDGDTFAVFMVFDNRLKKVWKRIHSPENHYISRYDGLYNEHSSFIKDTAVTLSELWEMGKNDAYYEQWASEEERISQYTE